MGVIVVVVVGVVVVVVVVGVVVVVVKAWKKMTVPTFCANNSSHQAPALAWVFTPDVNAKHYKYTDLLFRTDHLSQQQKNPFEVKSFFRRAGVPSRAEQYEIVNCSPFPTWLINRSSLLKKWKHHPPPPWFSRQADSPRPPTEPGSLVCNRGSPSRSPVTSSDLGLVGRCSP